MHTTATLHVHPACASNPRTVAAIQAATGCLAVISGRIVTLHARRVSPVPTRPFDGGSAA